MSRKSNERIKNFVLEVNFDSGASKKIFTRSNRKTPSFHMLQISVIDPMLGSNLKGMFWIDKK